MPGLDQVVGVKDVVDHGGDHQQQAHQHRHRTESPPQRRLQHNPSRIAEHQADQRGHEGEHAGEDGGWGQQRDDCHHGPDSQAALINPVSAFSGKKGTDKSDAQWPAGINTQPFHPDGCLPVEVLEQLNQKDLPGQRRAKSKQET
jgi:hypothetical protein